MADGLRIEVSDDFARILDHVEPGQDLVLTRNGAVVAFLRPATIEEAELEAARLARRTFIEEFLDYRRAHRAGLLPSEVVELVRADRDRDG